MKVNEFDKKVFLNFASKKIGLDAGLFQHDMKFVQTENGSKLKFYIGGESADLRKFMFTDSSCVYFNGLYDHNVDVSREWILYLADEVCTNEDEANYFIDQYNEALEAKIQEYAEDKRSLRINL